MKRMVQARLLRKNNTDSHYANAIYSFLKERAVLNITSTAMFSADAKCKVTVGEPDYPIAAVSRGKAVIVGKNEVFKVGDHDFSRVSLIPDATLTHTIPEQDEEDENTEYNKQSVGKWYTGKVFYSIKDMPTQGSSAMRGVAELSAALTSHYELEECPSRMYLYTDGGSDRKNSNFKVQKSLISLFLYHDFDDLISARPAAGHSYRNPVERCHCIANLGIQSVGMMRFKQSANFERSMSKCNGNEDIRKECESNETFKQEFKESVRRPRELLEEVLSNLSLKDEPFEILQPAADGNLAFLEEDVRNFEDNFKDMNSFADMKNFPKFSDFYSTHCNSRTYFF